MVREDERGRLLLFLHAHLPYVRHPEHSDALEEDWLYEAITETYLPLLGVLEGWRDDGVAARLTLSISPPLLEMLRDELLIGRYRTRLDRLLELAESEVSRSQYDDRFGFTARMYRDRLADAARRFDMCYAGDLVAAFKGFADAGILELVTSCATHAFLPCFDEDFARVQIGIGADSYRDHFGCDPSGMWLPECGFVPGLDRLLAEEGVSYFFVDAHAVDYADQLPVFGTYSPLVCPSGVVAFPRDRESSAQVWSADFGYPGDARYREFYRDIGHDLDGPSTEPFRLPDGTRRNVGLKYYRVTGRDTALADKQPYDRGAALGAVAEHAAHFVAERARQINYWRSVLGRPPIVVSPYDAELFGHWWFEGPEFLDAIVRKSVVDQQTFRLSSPSDVLTTDLEFQVAMPAASSWGAYGYSDTWLNDRNDWVWPLVHRTVSELTRIVALRPHAEGLEQRALRQLVREALLASASDWPFIITMGTTVSYAEARVRTHVERFDQLRDQILRCAIDENWLSRLEECDMIFKDLDYHHLVGGSS